MKSISGAFLGACRAMTGRWKVCDGNMMSRLELARY